MQIIETIEASPSSLSAKVSSSPSVVPDYDWMTQSRFDRETITNGTTYNTKQTFNSKGQPCDQTSDQD
jgi:hypothetical protein